MQYIATAGRSKARKRRLQARASGSSTAGEGLQTLRFLGYVSLRESIPSFAQSYLHEAKRLARALQSQPVFGEVMEVSVTSGTRLSVKASASHASDGLEEPSTYVKAQPPNEDGKQREDAVAPLFGAPCCVTVAQLQRKSGNNLLCVSFRLQVVRSAGFASRVGRGLPWPHAG